MKATQRQNKHRYCVIVSLGARGLVPAFFAELGRYSTQNHCEIECCLLDVPEASNMQHLMGLNESQASDLVSHQVTNIRNIIFAEFPSAQITKWSEYNDHKSFQRYVRLLAEEYTNNKSFRNNCHSQTFSNLEPILRSKGIVKKNHPTVAALSSYLIHELALLLFLEQQRAIAGFIAPKPEMQIQTALANGRYPNLVSIAGNHKPTLSLVVQHE